MKVVKFNNVRWPLPCSCSDWYAFIAIGKQGERPRLFRSPPGIGFAHLKWITLPNRIRANMNRRPSMQRLLTHL